MNPNPEGTVYGTIIVGALLAAEAGESTSYGKTVAAVVLALLIYWLAHAYSELAGNRVTRGEELTAAAFVKELLHELWMLAGAALPLLSVLISWAVGAQLEHALTAGVLTAAAAIVVIEVLAARRAELTGDELVKQLAVGLVLGGLVFALKAVLH